MVFVVQLHNPQIGRKAFHAFNDFPADQWVPADELNAEAFAGGVYHTGDVVTRDADGYLTFVGRADDVFKASDYRISPFELESVLIEHPAVAEAAVVPSPDPVRLAVPKAYVTLVEGREPSAELAADIRARVEPLLTRAGLSASGVGARD